MTQDEYDLTIVIEMDTKDITGGIYDYQTSIKNWVEQGESLAIDCELIIVSGLPCAGVESLSGGKTAVKNLCLSGASYYALKNAGANAAKGKIVLFTDSDCRPGNDYLPAMFEAFRSSEGACVAGRSVYDGNDLLTRMNTTASFGYLHQGETLTESCVLAHNVALRRGSFDHDPFGPYQGRVGGDMYLTSTYRALHPIPVVKGMLIFHENPTYNLRGLLDRHLREIFDALKRRVKARTWPGALAGLWFALRITLKRPKAHFRKIKKYGNALGIRRYHYPAVLAVLAIHQIIDMLAVIIILITPGLRNRWISYQFGPDYPY